MSRRSRHFAPAVFLSLAGVAVCLIPAGEARDPELVERGRYLVEAIGCTDCHTPKRLGPNGPEPIPGMHLAGHPQDMALPPIELAEGPWVGAFSGSMSAWHGPWGTSFTANLTPDDETGIGTWTPDVFLATLRTGKRMGLGRDLLPPMPWEVYGKLSDDDLLAVFAYLQSLPPVSNRVPQPIPPAR